MAVYEKKMIVISGVKSSVKGTAVVERGGGVFCSINILLDDLASGDYIAALRQGHTVFKRPLGLSGKISARFEIDFEPDFESLHIIIYSKTRTGAAAVAYGTNAKNRLWQGNLLDGLDGGARAQTENENEQGKAQAVSAKETPKKGNEDLEAFVINYSGRSGNALFCDEQAFCTDGEQAQIFSRDINEYFLDILPSSGGYRDGAVAINNYYQVKTAAIERELMPWELCRDYLLAQSNSYNNERLKPQSHVEYEQLAQRDYMLKHHNFDPVPPNEYIQQESVGRNLADFGQTERKNTLKQPEPKPEPFSLAKRAEEIMNPKPVRRRGRRAGKAKQNESVSESSTVTAQTASEAAMSADSATAAKERAEGFTNIPPVTKSTEMVRDTQGRISPLTFYQQVHEQVEQLFSQFPPEKELMRILPDTRWVKVDYDGNGRVYVVGLIGEKPDYICYGVPSDYTPSPPPELDGYCQWLPSDEHAPQGKGYWLMYQDAVTGESVDEL